MRQSNTTKKHWNNSWELSPLTQNVASVSCHKDKSDLGYTFFCHKESHFFEQEGSDECSNDSDKEWTDDNFKKLSDKKPYCTGIEVQIVQRQFFVYTGNGIEHGDSESIFENGLSENNRE